MATRSDKWRVVIEVELDHEATASELEYELAHGLAAGVTILNAEAAVREEPGFIVQRARP